MRTLGATVAVLAAVGCAEDGVYIEVVADGMTEVELFVVKSRCDYRDTGDEQMDPRGDCRGGLQPDGFDAKVDAPIFIRDQDEGEVWRVPVVDGSAWFRFGLDPKFPLQRVVVVGYDGDLAVQATSLTQVDLARSRKVIVELDDMVSWQSPTDAPGAKLALKQWADGRCIGVREGDESFFVVTEGDADCDQAMGTECDPLAYLVDRPIGAACLSSMPGRCSIGSTACSETMPGPTTGDICEPGDYDLDPRVCSTCDGVVLDQNVCIETQILDGALSIECNFYYQTDDNGLTCPDGTLGGEPTHIVRQSSPGFFCPTDFGIAAPELPFTGFDRDYEDATWATVKVERIDDGSRDCVKVEWIPAAVDGMDLVPTGRRLLFWSIGEPDGPNHVVPIRFIFTPGCQVALPTCKLVTP